MQSELCLRSSFLGAKALGFEVMLDRSLHGSFDSDDQTHSEVSDAVQLELMGGN